MSRGVESPVIDAQVLYLKEASLGQSRYQDSDAMSTEDQFTAFQAIQKMVSAEHWKVFLLHEERKVGFRVCEDQEGRQDMYVE